MLFDKGYDAWIGVTCVVYDNVCRLQIECEL